MNSIFGSLATSGANCVEIQTMNSLAKKNNMIKYCDEENPKTVSVTLPITSTGQGEGITIFHVNVKIRNIQEDANYSSAT